MSVSKRRARCFGALSHCCLSPLAQHLPAAMTVMTPPLPKSNKLKNRLMRRMTPPLRQLTQSANDTSPKMTLTTPSPLQLEKLTMRKLLMTSAILLLPACAITRPIVTTPRANCADLVPVEWAQPVPAVAIPQNDPLPLGVPLTNAMAAQLVAPWAIAYVAMSGQLEKANGRTADAITIVKDCERRANEARSN